MNYADLYREAVIRENTIRDLAFLSCPESISGLDVKPLTVKHLILLDGSSNPFLYYNPEPSEQSVVKMVLFLWAVSARYEQGEGKAKNKFVKLCRKLNYKQTSEEIRAYVDEAFMDAPPSGKSSPSYTSLAASVVDIIASEYGWVEEIILEIPLKRIFQYMKRIAARKGETVFFNPSDKVRGDWLRFNTECAQKMVEYEMDLARPYRWENN